jgi:DNA-binding MurR/RpiR family transcriptional regulator
MRSFANQPDPPAPAPATFGGYQTLRDEIVRRQEGLPRRLLQIAAFALDRPDEVAFGTVSSLAKTIGVPPSAIIRFAQHFRFDGFVEMQRLFRDRIRKRSSEYEQRLQTLNCGMDPQDEAGKTLEGFLAAGRRSMDGAQASISHDAFSTAASVLANGETIYLLARRRSFPVASHMAYSLGKLGLRCELIGSPMGVDTDLLQFAGPRDVAFAISFSPYAPETVAQARLLRERGVPLVSLTDSPFSPIAAISNVWFEVVEADYGGFRPLSASMTLALALSVAVAEQKQRSEAH